MAYVAEAFGPDGFGNYRVEWVGGVPHFERVSRPAEVLLVPGFVDIHIHGAFGIDFMSATVEDMKVLCTRLEGYGYDTFYPTTVTASLEAVQAALRNLPDHPMVAGFHLEGPFISPSYPGAQPPSFIIDPQPVPSEWDVVLEDPRLKVITLAPERPHALKVISFLAQRGVTVSMGHTDATYDESRFGFEFGASHATHTFNAMRPFHHREVGAVGYALAQDGLTCEVIYDRLHVGKEAVQHLLKSKPLDKVIAVSDSTMATGLPPNQRLEMWGLKVVTGKDEVRLAEGGALAGSAVTLFEVFQNLAEDFGRETAIRLCSLNPRKAMSLGAPKVYLEMDRNMRIVGRHERVNL